MRTEKIKFYTKNVINFLFIKKNKFRKKTKFIKSYTEIQHNKWNSNQNDTKNSKFWLKKTKLKLKFRLTWKEWWKNLK